jgi:hypothetical protein
VLLLVLILVLLAFGLLVVALLSGSVLWAWVSVAVSVAAAAVLLLDWLQRRSAVRAGAQAGKAGSALGPDAPSTVPPPALPRVPELYEAGAEPATEILPVVRPDAPPPGVDAGPRDERQETQETVVLRAVPPSGSEEQPSGARGGITSSGPNSSHSVTAGAPDDTAAVAPEGREDARAEADGDAEDTVKVIGSGGPAERRESAPEVPGRPLVVGSGSTRLDLPPLGPDGAPPEEPRDAEAAGLVAELDDEVLVVDELPRYHLGGCGSLQGRPVIPLPVREAVELGFTPCAWCTPDRALSSRHGAAAPR